MKIFASNLLIMSAIALLITISGCTQQEVEPDPADQVLGVYGGTNYTESINGVAQSIDLTNALIKDNVTISMDVAKKSASVIAIVLRISQRDSTGVMQTYTDTYDTIDLKAMSNGEFDMQNAGVSVGQIGNSTLKLQETYSDNDENGSPLQVTVTIAAKKM
jgi:uncharacterized lipoprotein YehR (DUF1307 family)